MEKDALVPKLSSFLFVVFVFNSRLCHFDSLMVALFVDLLTDCRIIYVLWFYNLSFKAQLERGVLPSGTKERVKCQESFSVWISMSYIFKKINKMHSLYPKNMCVAAVENNMGSLESACNEAEGTQNLKSTAKMMNSLVAPTAKYTVYTLGCLQGFCLLVCFVCSKALVCPLCHGNRFLCILAAAARHCGPSATVQGKVSPQSCSDSSI